MFIEQIRLQKKKNPPPPPKKNTEWYIFLHFIVKWELF